MIKKLINRYTAKKIAANYSSYTEFAHNASPEEKQKVISDALVKANKIQRQVSGLSR